MQSLCILGRQPSLGIAELESLYGSKKLQLISDQAVIIDIDPCILSLDQIGGSIKLCKVLTTLDTIVWADIRHFLLKAAPEHAQKMPKGKMYLGISVYGLRVSPQQIVATGLEIKKTIQLQGRSVRFIANKSTALNSAQVIHNKLTGSNGWELVFVRSGNKTICAQTVKEQDIKSYTLRDRSRPKRDMKRGMLPPKLAQIIVNLSRGELNTKTLNDICSPQQDYPNLREVVLDPFCGTGVILQEAILMGYNVYGTDIDQKIIEYSQVNLDWLKKNYLVKKNKLRLSVGDASSYKWQPFNMVASELYLGPAFGHLPELDKIKAAQKSCNNILRKFLINIRDQVTSGTRFCLAIPAWQVQPSSFLHLPIIDHLKELGYNRFTFKDVNNNDLIYYRPDQIVARELLVIIRK